MKKFEFCCNATLNSEIFEFNDTWTREEIEQELWNWAEQFLDAWLEEIDEDEDE